MKPTHRLAALSLSLSLAACGNGTMNNNNPDMANAGAICTMPTTVPCQDQAVLQLSLKTAPSTRVITNAADGAGWISTVDATAGGFTPTESFVYAKFTDQGLQTVSIGDEASLTSMDWDIAFRRYYIRLNSGTSGPSCVGALTVPSSVTYDSLTTPPSGGSYNNENFFTDTCQLIDDGSGLPGPLLDLSSFWKYASCVQMTHNVFAIRLASGQILKLTVEDYYSPAVQDTCDTTGMISMNMPTGSANVRVRWAFLSTGTK